jgi:hypothetical protein
MISAMLISERMTRLEVGIKNAASPQFVADMNDHQAGAQLTLGF